MLPPEQAWLWLVKGTRYQRLGVSASPCDVHFDSSCSVCLGRVVLEVGTTFCGAAVVAKRAPGTIIDESKLLVGGESAEVLDQRQNLNLNRIQRLSPSPSRWLTLNSSQNRPLS